jgi:fermentation-respiration switch protein FrsA (DUF1100 family)
LYSIVVTVATILAVGYATLLAIVFAFQARLLYLPNIAGAGLAATPASIGLPFEEAHPTTSDGVKLHGWLVLAPRSERIVLHFHGNGGNISHRLELLRILHGMGLSVFLFDYRGYGLSEGRPSEAGTYLDAAAAWTYLVEQRGYAPDDIILFGHSLGAAVAAYLARQVRPGALILESPFTSIPDIAAHHYWFIPARSLARFRYTTADYVRAVNAPVLVLHSASDAVVPFEHGREVFRNANDPKTFLEILGGHNAGAVVDEAQYTNGLRQFIATLPGAPSTSTGP